MINTSLFSTGTNTWETPLDLFLELDEEFHFTLDPCAEPHTAKCKKYYTKQDDGLSKDWTGETVFCNPPYSDKEQTEWIKKCYKHGLNGGVAVMLIPSRTDTRRFHDYILNKAEVRFISGRLKFGDSVNSAPFPSMIVVFGKKGKVIMKNNMFRPSEGLLNDTERTMVLVDYSNLLYRAWFVSAKRPWVAFCKFFDMLRLCVKRSKQKGVPLGVIFCGESKTRLKRRDIFEDYKGTRVHTEDPKFRKFRNDLAEMLNFLDLHILSVDGAEADDIIASIVAKYCHRCFCKVPCADCDCASRYKTDVVIFSGDRDLQQCLAWDRTLIYRAPGLFVSKDTFEEEYGIPVTKYGVFKALVGDKSDNIKGVEGFGPAKAQIAIRAGSVAEDIWEMGDIKASDEFKLALKLVNLDTKLDLDFMEELYFGPPRFEEDFSKKYDKRILFEIKRLKEEF